MRGGEPGSLVLANGSRMIASAMRWSDQGLKALTRSGLTAIPFGTISDLCVPRVDVMPAVPDDNFYLLSGRAGDRKARDGAGSDADLFPRDDAGGREQGVADEQDLLVQPSWSLGMILVPIDSIWRRAFGRRMNCRSPRCRRKRLARRWASTTGPGGGTRTSRGARWPAGRSRWTWASERTPAAK